MIAGMAGCLFVSVALGVHLPGDLSALLGQRRASPGGAGMSTVPRQTRPRVPMVCPEHLGARVEPGPPGEVRLRAHAAGVRARRADAARRRRAVRDDLPGRHSRAGADRRVRAARRAGRAPGTHQGADPVAYGSLGGWWPASAVGRAGTGRAPWRARRRLRARPRAHTPDADASITASTDSTCSRSPTGRSARACSRRSSFRSRPVARPYRGCRPDRSSSIAGWRHASPGCPPTAPCMSPSGSPGSPRWPTRARSRRRSSARSTCRRPPTAERWRAVHAELERLACHFDVIAKEAETTALYVGQARFQILKERVTRLRARLTGSRFGRGVVVPGGVRFAPRASIWTSCAPSSTRSSAN